MTQNQETLESLSAYMDGELQVEYRDGFLADVKSDESLRAQWSVYHCIGDVLRSDDMASIPRHFRATLRPGLTQNPTCLRLKLPSRSPRNMRRSGAHGACRPRSLLASLLSS